MNIKPLHDWAVIVPSAAEEISAGGLYIPETAKSKPQEGIVEAIGPGAFEEEKRQKKIGDKKKERRFIPTVVKPGDRVLYERYAAQTYRMNDEERILVRERDILGILPEGSLRPRPVLIPATTTSSGPTTPASLPGMEAAVPVAREKASAKAAPKKTEKKAVKNKAATKKEAPAKPAPKPKGKASAKKKG